MGEHWRMSGGEGEILQQTQKKKPNSAFQLWPISIFFLLLLLSQTIPSEFSVLPSNLSLFLFFLYLILLLWDRSTSYLNPNSVFRSATLPRVLILSWQYVRDLVWTESPLFSDQQTIDRRPPRTKEAYFLELFWTLPVLFIFWCFCYLC